MDQTAYNASVIRRLYDEAMNRRNVALVDGLIAPAVTVQAQSAPKATLPREGFKNVLLTQWRNTPDHQYQILDLIAFQDRVAVRLKATYKHTLPAGNIPPTGRMLEAKEMCFYRLENGLIVEVTTLVDEAGIIQQCAPTPGAVGRW